MGNALWDRLRLTLALPITTTRAPSPSYRSGGEAQSDGAVRLTPPSARAWWPARSTCLRTTCYLEPSIWESNPTFKSLRRHFLCRDALWGRSPGRVCDPRREYSTTSSARTVVECIFGILASQWRIYRCINLKPGNTEACVKARCVWHNLLRWTRRDQPRTGADCMRGGREAQPTGGKSGIRRLGNNNATREAMTVRET